MRSPFVPLGIAVGALAVFAVGFVLVGLGGWGPAAANEQAIGEVSRWCERVSGGLLREPVNTLGNLGFVVVGLAIFWTLARDERLGRRGREGAGAAAEPGSTAASRFFGNTPTALLYASAVTFLGPGSMLMHGSHTRAGAWLDNVSMVAYILVPCLVNLATLGGWRDRTMYAVYAAVLSTYAAGYWFIGPDLGIGLDLFELAIAIWVVSEVLYRWWAPGRWSVPILLGSGLVGFALGAAFGITPARMLASPDQYWWVVLFWLPALLARRPAPDRRRYTPWFWLGFASFFAAYTIWLTGTAGHPLCAPDSPIQAHAIWHLLSAAATACFFIFLRTGRLVPRIAEQTLAPTPGGRYRPLV
jgi:hypothetical protein